MAERLTEQEMIAALPVPDVHDSGGIVTIQILDPESEQLVRRQAYISGLGTAGAVGYYRVDPLDAWTPAAVDAVVPVPGVGSVYCLHRVTPS